MLADLVDRHDRRVPQLGDAAGLAQEAVEVLAAGQVAGAGDLDGHDAVELRVARLVDRAERRHADRLDQLERPSLPARSAPLQGAVDPARVRTMSRTWADHFPVAGRGQTGQLDRVPAVGAADLHVGIRGARRERAWPPRPRSHPGIAGAREIDPARPARRPPGGARPPGEAPGLRRTAHRALQHRDRAADSRGGR